MGDSAEAIRRKVQTIGRIDGIDRIDEGSSMRFANDRRRR
jgi:hypothetical protein